MPVFLLSEFYGLCLQNACSVKKNLYARLVELYCFVRSSDSPLRYEDAKNAVRYEDKAGETIRSR